MMNKVCLVGRLTRDPELRVTPGTGIQVATFTLAVDRNFKNKQGEREADFIRIVAWRRLAELCTNYLGKGRLVGVTGRIQVRNWEDEAGQRRSVTEVVADEVVFLDRGPGIGAGGVEFKDYKGDEGSSDDDFYQIEEDPDLPF